MPKAATPTRPPPIRMVVVEPYVLVRAVLRGIVSWEPDIEIVGEVTDIQAAITLVRDEPADVVLVDTELAGPELVPDLQRLRGECPGSGVVLLGHRRDDDELLRAIESGAAAHVLDTVRPTVLVATIRAVASGESLIDQSLAARPTVARRVLEAFREGSPLDQVSDRTAPRLERLSGPETEVLTAISQGMSNRDIATQLAISPLVVKRLVKDVLRKLAVNVRAEASFAANGSAVPGPWDQTDLLPN